MMDCTDTCVSREKRSQQKDWHDARKTHIGPGSKNIHPQADERAVHERFTGPEGSRPFQSARIESKVCHPPIDETREDQHWLLAPAWKYDIARTQTSYLYARIRVSTSGEVLIDVSLAYQIKSS